MNPIKTRVMPIDKGAPEAPFVPPPHGLAPPPAPEAPAAAVPAVPTEASKPAKEDKK